jgi:hypothetical protein
MLGQAAHHGVDADPWLEATCLPTFSDSA